MKTVLGAMGFVVAAVLACTGCSAEVDPADQDEELVEATDDAVVGADGSPGAGTLYCRDNVKLTRDPGDNTRFVNVTDGTCTKSGEKRIASRDNVRVAGRPTPGIKATLELRPIGTTASKFLRPTGSVTFTGLKKKPGKTYYTTLLLFTERGGENGFAEAQSVTWNGRNQTINLTLEGGDDAVREAEGGLTDALFPANDTTVRAVVGVYEYDANTNGRNHRMIAMVEQNATIGGGE